ncbi:hypothetical protein DPMN_159687 [Dreissena polymorpha]|uniref:Uncharacterized protein n=1 Tax=Dreissena polymorpha TaxID=45954 RepID=A0A9D4EM41_DREPO|nr:hypothetical protein DPMN_159687 [Dreissena polymorpha]
MEGILQAITIVAKTQKNFPKVACITDALLTAHNAKKPTTNRLQLTRTLLERYGNENKFVKLEFRWGQQQNGVFNNDGECTKPIAPWD